MYRAYGLVRFLIIVENGPPDHPRNQIRFFQVGYQNLSPTHPIQQPTLTHPLTTITLSPHLVKHHGQAVAWPWHAQAMASALISELGKNWVWDLGSLVKFEKTEKAISAVHIFVLIFH